MSIYQKVEKAYLQTSGNKKGKEGEEGEGIRKKITK